MTPRHSHEHLSAAAIQALLDGELPSGERSRAEEHLGTCPRCSSQLEAWNALFSELGELPRLVPHEGFQARVMPGVSRPVGLGLAARVRARVSAFCSFVSGCSSAMIDRASFSSRRAWTWYSVESGSVKLPNSSRSIMTPVSGSAVGTDRVVMPS